MNTTLKQRAYESIRSKIEVGDLWAGVRLSELSLSRELGISRTPIREAIHQLASEGIVEHVPHYGSFVKRHRRDELVELFELRETLECYAVARAAQHISETDLTLLEGLCSDMRPLVREALQSPLGVIDGQDAARWVINDSVFHMLLIRAARNRSLLRIINDLHLMTRMFGQRREPLSGRNLAGIYAGHSRIVRALRRGDAELAQREMSRHIQRGCRLVLAMCDRDDGDGAVSTPQLEAWPEEVRGILQRFESFNSPPRAKAGGE